MKKSANNTLKPASSCELEQQAPIILLMDIGIIYEYQLLYCPIHIKDFVKSSVHSIFEKKIKQNKKRNKQNKTKQKRQQIKN